MLLFNKRVFSVVGIIFQNNLISNKVIYAVQVLNSASSSELQLFSYLQLFQSYFIKLCNNQDYLLLQSVFGLFFGIFYL
jgi:hypothetical protein